jgi:mannan endo-1,4-beta-mannosidase
VTAIAKNAFAGCTKLKKVTIGKNVTSIGKNAFSGDSKLKTIIIKSKVLTKVGENAFKGIPSNATIKVPSSKVKAYKKLLTGKGQGKNVTIKK